MTLIKDIKSYENLKIHYGEGFLENLRKNKKLYNKIMKKIISLSYDEINEKDEYDRSPLILLCISNENTSDIFAIIKLLLKNGADVNMRDIYGKTALYYSIPKYIEYIDYSNNELEKMKILLEYGASINLEYDKDKIIFNRLSNYDDKNLRNHDVIYTIIAKLIYNSVDLNSSNIDGGISIDLLFELCNIKLCSSNKCRKFIKILSLLLEKIDNIEIIDRLPILHKLFEPIYYHGNENKVELLENILKIVKKILEKGMDVNKQDKYGNIPLLYLLNVVDFKGERIVNPLIDKNIREKIGELINLLLEYGSNLTIKNNNDECINDLLANNISIIFFNYRMKKMEERIKELEGEIEILKYVPGNSKYFETMKDFDRLRNRIV